MRGRLQCRSGILADMRAGNGRGSDTGIGPAERAQSQPGHGGLSSILPAVR